MADPDSDQISESGHASEIGERERRMLERSMLAYASHMRNVARFQRSVIEFRRVKASHDQLHGVIAELARNREAAAEGRIAIRAAIRAFVHVLRADDRAPEVALGMTKRAIRAIVVSMPADESLPDPEPLFDDVVRWAIQAYYEAA